MTGRGDSRGCYV